MEDRSSGYCFPPAALTSLRNMFLGFFPTFPGLVGLCAVSSSPLHSCHHQLSSWLLSQIALPSSHLLWGWDQARGSGRDLELLWHGVGMALECSERNCNGKREEETTPWVPL